MLSSISLAFAVSAVAQVALAAPAANAEPEFELLKRQGLAEVFTSCSQPNTVALTFDDGPYIFESGIVQTLNNNGIKGTFFVNGNNWECVYDDSAIASLRSAYNSGHLIGSHTWAHLDLSTLSWDQIHDQMWRTEQALTRILGVTPAWMRPPYGNYNDLVRSAAAVRNQNLVLWDFDSGDSTGSSAQQIRDAYADLANRRPNSVLALNHETSQATAQEVLQFAIDQLRAKGYNFATVAECLNRPAYASVSAPGNKDGSWTC